jgi:hypothetical protein
MAIKTGNSEVGKGLSVQPKALNAAGYHIQCTTQSGKGFFTKREQHQLIDLLNLRPGLPD